MHISIVEIGQNQRREGDPKWYGTCSITNYEYTKQTLLRLLGPASPRRSGGDDLVIMMKIAITRILRLSPVRHDFRGCLIFGATRCQSVPFPALHHLPYPENRERTCFWISGVKR
jgi:hypothetical protein